MEWHSIDIAEALQELSSDARQGLTRDEAARRLAEQGPNELLDAGGSSAGRILWEQFTSTMALILTGAALVSGLIGDLKDSIAILAIVCLFALLGFVQEYRAERAMRAMRRLAAPTVRVRRDGAVSEIAARELVPGDVVLLESGNLVPADCRLLEAHNLRTQEAMLTGEADAVEKSTALLPQPGLSLGDRRNMLYMGTTVSYGRGLALVTSCGMRTELGRIAHLLQGVRQEWTPLQKRLDRLGKLLALVAVMVALLFFLTGLALGQEWRILLMTAVSLAVAVIPEGLPAVVTITLAIGAQRMLRRHALIRKLPAVETLGSVTVICSDKTGTLTQNRMSVTELVAAAAFEGTGRERALLAVGVLCNDAALSEESGTTVITGDPTEGALLMAAAQQGEFRPDLELLFPRIAEIPFDSSTKRMLTVHAVGDPALGHPLAVTLGLQLGDRLLAVKGAPDRLLPLCTLDAGQRTALEQQVERLSSSGRRVLALAVRVLRSGTPLDIESCCRDLVAAGLAAMMDPPRSEARQAVEACRQAGIRPVMITGDHPATAAAIGSALGISDSGRVLTGSELEQLGAAGLAGVVGEVAIYARVSPEHKLLIVEALQTSGEVAAMTGDGVNDAPALKRADIGVAMGQNGSDVAREAADMVLLDDNFATIVAAVEEGRTIYDNIRKFLVFSVSGNLGKLLAVVALPFFGLPIPLTPLQLLWLNLLTDGLLGLGMGMERAEPDVMRRPPLVPNSPVFARRTIVHVLLTGSVIGISTILLTLHHWRHHHDSWQTVLFTSLALVQVGQAMALRSASHSFFSMGIFGNPVLLAMAACVTALQGAVLYLPAAGPLFATLALAPEPLLLSFLPALTVFAILELEKIALRRSGLPGAY